MRIRSPTASCSRHRALVVTAASLGILAASPSILAAQTYWWRIPAAAGGAFVGAGVGYVIDVARWGGRDLGGPSFLATPVGIGLGGLAGFLGGLSADRRLARGDTVTRGARAALRLATFLAPVATGSAIAFAIINPSEEPRCVPSGGGCLYEPERKVAPDEMVALIGIGGGIVLGYVAQHRFARALQPKVRVGVAPGGRGVMVSIPVGR